MSSSNDLVRSRVKLLKRVADLLLFFSIASASAEVRVFIQDSNSVAWVKYECTAGEVVRAFALDVTVDTGHIIGITNFLRGPSTTQNPGYGIFPASFRDHLTVGPGTNVNWNVAAYTPLAVVADNPGDTQAGLNSAGVTLEFGGVWDPGDPAAVPGATGTLCSLQISEEAMVSVAANAARGGVVSTNPVVVLTPTFTGAVVPSPPMIYGQVQLQGFTGVGPRTVQFVASDGGGVPLETNDVSLTFGGSPKVANYNLSVPTNTAFLSAKTEWNLRRRQGVTFVSDVATNDFTGSAGQLLGGDISQNNNLVNTADYTVLKGNWLKSTVEADITGDGLVNTVDYTILKGNWLKTGDLQ